MKDKQSVNVAIRPTSTTSVNVIHFEHDGTWEFCVAYLRGKGKLFNLYTKYTLYRVTGDRACDRVLLWRGWPSGAPDPMDPSENRSVYDYLRQTPLKVRWLERKIADSAREAAL